MPNDSPPLEARQALGYSLAGICRSYGTILLLFLDMIAFYQDLQEIYRYLLEAIDVAFMIGVVVHDTLWTGCN